MSDFARAAVLQNVHAARTSTGSLSGDLATLSRELSELDALLGDIHKRIRGVLGPASSERKEYQTDEQHSL